MIRAAALSYAIVFSLLVGLICSGVIFISATQKKIEVLQTNSEHLLFDSYVAVQLGMHSVQPGDSVSYIHPSGDTSIIIHRQWGAFSMISVVTHKGSGKRQRSALTGLIQAPQLPCFYLSGNSSGLKITGETHLEGTVFVPKGSVERAYIAGKNYTREQLVYGKIETAETGLPPLKPQWRDLQAGQLTSGLSARPYSPRDSSYSFHHSTTYYRQFEPIVIGNSIHGNVIIHSYDSIFVEARAQLSNVILIAPVVRFEAGFTGNVQVVAHESITCEKDVHLTYPSILALNELSMRNIQRKRTLVLDENTEVLGGILITSQSSDFRKLPFLELRPGSVAAGLIYNSGETEACGTIIGSLFTSQLSVRTGGGMYGNHLVDAHISTKRLPSYFLLPGWLEQQHNVRPKILAWL